MRKHIVSSKDVGAGSKLVKSTCKITETKLYDNHNNFVEYDESLQKCNGDLHIGAPVVSCYFCLLLQSSIRMVA